MIETLKYTPRTIRWLWYPHIPYGGITLIQGAPGTGKSFFLSELAAEASLGFQEIDQLQGESPYVLLQCADDVVSDVKHRLQMSGASLDRVAYFERLNNHLFSINDLPALQCSCGKKFALILIDPIEAYLEEQDDEQKARSSIRELICQLNLQARLNDWALVLTTAHDKMHGTESDKEYGKIEDLKEIKSVLKIQETGVSRQNHIVSQTKNEYAPCGAPLHFQIGEKIGLHWIGLRPDFQNIETEYCNENVSAKEAAADWMKNALINNGEVPGKEIIRTLVTAGFKEQTIKNVRKLSGIHSIRRNRQWFWYM